MSNLLAQLAPYYGIIALSFFLLIFGLVVINIVCKMNGKPERTKKTYVGGSYRGWTKGHKFQ